MNEYQVKIRDDRKIKRRFLYFLLLATLFLIISFIFTFQNTTLEDGGYIVLFICPVLFYLFASFIALKSVKSDSPVSINENVISSKYYGDLEILEIASVEIPINYNGHHSLLKLTMKSGEIYSINVLNKYNGMANDEFDSFILTFKKVLKKNNLGIKS